MTIYTGQDLCDLRMALEAEGAKKLSSLLQPLRDEVLKINPKFHLHLEEVYNEYGDDGTIARKHRNASPTNR